VKSEGCVAGSGRAREDGRLETAHIGAAGRRDHEKLRIA
jgi:hypothetical protein